MSEGSFRHHARYGDRPAPGLRFEIGGLTFEVGRSDALPFTRCVLCGLMSSIGGVSSDRRPPPTAIHPKSKIPPIPCIETTE